MKYLKRFALSACCMSMLVSTSVLAVDVAQYPVINNDSGVVPPNIYFILDDSGSMDSLYTPDVDVNNHSLSGFGDSENNGFCYHWSGYNTQWYNPSITYTVPVNASGTALTSSPYTYTSSSGATKSATGNYAVNNGYSSSTSARDMSTAWSNNYYGGSSTPYAYVIPSGSSATAYSNCTSTTSATRSTANTSTSGWTIKTWSGMTAADKQNYAVWYTYYHTRLMAMKAAASLAFKNTNGSYRLGFSTISSTGVTDSGTNTGEFMKFNALSATDSNGQTHKARFYDMLFSQTGNSYTPLRGALSKAGRIYAGQLLTGDNDPVLYSCQKNFTILSTDGYWNTNAESSSYGPYKIDNTTYVGDQDGSTIKTVGATDSVTTNTVTGTINSSVTGTVTLPIVATATGTATVVSTTSGTINSTLAANPTSNITVTASSTLNRISGTGNNSVFGPGSVTFDVQLAGITIAQIKQPLASSSGVTSPSATETATLSAGTTTFSGSAPNLAVTSGHKVADLNSTYSNASVTVTWSLSQPITGTVNITGSGTVGGAATSGTSSGSFNQTASGSSSFTINVPLNWTRSGATASVSGSATKSNAVNLTTAAQTYVTTLTTTKYSGSVTVTAAPGTATLTSSATGVVNQSANVTSPAATVNRTLSLGSNANTASGTVTQTFTNVLASALPPSVTLSNAPWTINQSVGGPVNISASGTVSGATATGTSTNTFSGVASGTGTQSFTVPVTWSGSTNLTAAGSANATKTATATNAFTTTISAQVLGGTVTRPSWDGLGMGSTLADVAYYYYHTDLRTGSSVSHGVTVNWDNNNVLPSGTSQSLDDIATWQHMTTFTLGLGVSGKVYYQSNYKNQISSRPAGVPGSTPTFYDIYTGAANWPDPINNTDAERIDDLWHAAVNGRGTYFSADSPTMLQSSIESALNAIQSVVGSGASAATSNLTPVSGDNYGFVASYTTAKWTGDLTAWTIDLATANLLGQDGVCVRGTSGCSAIWSAQTQLDTQVSDSTDTRVIYTYDGSAANKLKSFTWANLTPTEQGYFSSNISSLSQYTTWSANQLTNATGNALVNYLRGQKGTEASTANPDMQLFRTRDHALGDIVHGQPLYLSVPSASYTDTGYASFVSSNSGRTKSIFVGANDGMLHAFNATTGNEMWAYVPSYVMPQMYRLADTGYTTSAAHRAFVDGFIETQDVYYDSAWHTILVGGLGAGGAGYYALDVTDPTAPKALWNFTKTEASGLGLAMAKPFIAKRPSDGKWVVIVPSGYNSADNSGSIVGSSSGILYVLDAKTGSILSTISGAGTGLAQINGWIDAPATDRTVTQLYGGDLNGDMWRYAMSTDIASPDTVTVTKLAAVGKPITTKPELGTVSGGSKAVFFGTGSLLNTSDITDASVQRMYGIKDTDSGAVVTTTACANSSSTNCLIEQTISNVSGSTTLRSLSGNAVNWTTQNGWEFAFPDTGERLNVNPSLLDGILVLTSNIPTIAADVCSSNGGYSWLYYVDANNGGYTSASTMVGSQHLSGAKLSALSVGVTTVRLGSGESQSVGVVVTKADGTTISTTVANPAASPAASGRVKVERVTWREIIQ